MIPTSLPQKTSFIWGVDIGLWRNTMFSDLAAETVHPKVDSPNGWLVAQANFRGDAFYIPGTSLGSSNQGNRCAMVGAGSV